MIIAEYAEDAINEYAEVIEGSMDDYLENYSEDDYPNEITKEEAMQEYIHANFEHCITDEDKIKEFEKDIKCYLENEDMDAYLVLMDGSLL